MGTGYTIVGLYSQVRTKHAATTCVVRDHQAARRMFKFLVPQSFKSCLYPGCGSLTPQYRAGVPGQEKPDSQFVWFCLILEPGFLLVSGTGLLFEVQNPAAEKNVDTSRFWIIFENSQNSKQIIGTLRRSIFHAAKSSQMPNTATIQKIIKFDNKLWNLQSSAQLSN